jgi:hypothetical protein
MQTPLTSQRIQSVDFFRGITMFLLAGEASGLYELKVLVKDWIIMSGMDFIFGI